MTHVIGLYNINKDYLVCVNVQKEMAKYSLLSLADDNQTIRVFLDAIASLEWGYESE